MTDFAAVAQEIAKVDGGSGRDARRLFHGRGHCYPGLEHLSLDWFDPVLLLTLFEPEPDLDTLIATLREWGEPRDVNALVVQHRYAQGPETELLWGDLPRKAVARENGLDYGIQLSGRQNTGFFLDMSQVRDWVRSAAAERRVLNLFAYTCAFSVVARAGGARRVINLDMAGSALRQGQQNHQRNGLLGGVSFLAHDLFRSWGKLHRLGPFDLLIVDPPSRQPGSFVAGEDYPRVISRLEALCAPGADVLLCLNSPHLASSFLRDLVAQSAPGLEFVERLPNPASFPDADPERSLKVLRFRQSESR